MRYERNRKGIPAVLLEDVKIHIRVDGTSFDSEVQTFIEAATEELEAYCEIALTRQGVTVWTEAEGGEVITLPVGPLASGATVEVNGTAVTTEGGRHPRITLPDDVSGAITITYEAGFTITPPDMQLAIKEQVAMHFDMRGEGLHGLAPGTARICARHRRVTL